jgi:hypothetical protein
MIIKGSNIMKNYTYINGFFYIFGDCGRFALTRYKHQRAAERAVTSKRLKFGYTFEACQEILDAKKRASEQKKSASSRSFFDIAKVLGGFSNV